MTKQLTSLLKRIKVWPKGMQSEAVDALRAIEEERFGVGEPSAEDIAAAGRIATDVYEA